LPQLKSEGPNVKVVAAISWELFQRQSEDYRQSVISELEWMDAMVITNGARRLMHKWMANRVVEEYSMSPDFDNRWRTGGSVDEIIAESKLDPQSVWNGIMKFAADREVRLSQIRKSVPA
jgi:transketolase